MRKVWIIVFLLAMMASTPVWAQNKPSLSPFDGGGFSGPGMPTEQLLALAVGVLVTVNLYNAVVGNLSAGALMAEAGAGAPLITTPATTAALRAGSVRGPGLAAISVVGALLGNWLYNRY
ncbi:membrane hypothetical protein [Azospirillaceae bacterium]